MSGTAPHHDLSRRSVFAGMTGIAAIKLFTVPLSAAPEDMAKAVETIFGKKQIRDGRVALKMPALSENGNSVPLSISVESPMSESDHVISIHVFSPKNPLPNVARYFLGARAGKAAITTRIRLSDSQTILAIAEMSDGSLWSGSAETIVTLAACIDPGL